MATVTIGVFQTLETQKFAQLAIPKKNRRYIWESDEGVGSYASFRIRRDLNRALETEENVARKRSIDPAPAINKRTKNQHFPIFPIAFPQKNR